MTLRLLLFTLVMTSANVALATTASTPEPTPDVMLERGALPALPAFEAPSPALVVARSIQAFLEVFEIEPQAPSPDVMLPMYGLIADQSARQVPGATPTRIRLSSRFGKRFHPILKRWKLHNGVDFAAPRGTPVYAAAEGTVTFAGWRGAAGRYVQIQHDDGYTSSYMHLHRLHVRRGQRVGRADLIGQIGTTGRSTGPHLHFSVKRDGAYVDPLGAHGFDYAPPVRGTGLLIHYERQLARTLERPEELARTLARWAKRSPALLDLWPHT